MPTLLHISDLHRTSGPRFGNDDLFAAIASDATRWNREGIPNPDLIVVSGDLIQGASVTAPDPDSEIAAQYSEACGFLRQLAAEFVDSDLSRVVIVPGNHDVHRRRARNAMRPLVTCPNGIASKAIQATSSLRWNWDDQTAYEIFDRDLYESRLDHFRRFRESFYRDLDPTPLTILAKDRTFIPIPPEIANDFQPSAGERKRLEVRCDILYLGEHERVVP